MIKNYEQILEDALLSDWVTIAHEYGIKCHKDANHLYDGKPYEVHLEKVFLYVCKFGYLLDSKNELMCALASAWLHDTIEDTRQTYNDVKNAIGSQYTADVVYALTNEKGKTRSDRANDNYYEGIRNQPLALFVKLCDRMANIAYSLETKNDMFNIYKKENRYFLKQLWEPNYMDMYNEIHQLLNSK